MKDSGIRAVHKRKYKATTNSAHGKPIAPNLLNRNFKAEEINKVRVSDITYVWTEEGWFELIYTRDYLEREEAKTEIFEYIEIFYNRQRRHSSIKYNTPVEFEERNIKLVA